MPSSSSSVAKRSIVLYSCAVAVFCGGFTYSLVPLYRLFCQSLGLSGAPKVTQDMDNTMFEEKKMNQPITVRFIANTGKNLPWNFMPLQRTIEVLPGQASLAFFSALNKSNEDRIGIATYNIVPSRAALYFNKIQCFCFEEQRLGPGEQVDMPVFFYIDPSYSMDPQVRHLREIDLSYTFFESKN